jgi:hypothetical protein
MSSAAVPIFWNRSSWLQINVVPPMTLLEHGIGMMVLKKILRMEQRAMSSALLVEKAVRWADALARAECRQPGDYDNAMRRVGERIGVGYSTLWGLRYRQPKRIWADIYFALADAHEAMRQRQLEALETEIAEAKAAGRHHPAHVRAAEAVVERNRLDEE